MLVAKGIFMVKGILSVLWIGAAIQDLKTRKMGNMLTIPSAALALGFRAGQEMVNQGYLSLLLGGYLAALAIWRLGLFGGGDAKLLMALLAWRPGVETWMLVAGFVALVGLIAVAWRLVKKKEKLGRGYALGGAITLAGLAMLWLI